MPVCVSAILGYWKICSQEPCRSVKRVWDEIVWRCNGWGTEARLPLSAVRAAAAVCAAAAAVSLGSGCITVVIRTCSGHAMWLFRVIGRAHVVVVQV